MIKVELFSEDRGQGNETGGGGKVAQEEGVVKAARLSNRLRPTLKEPVCCVIETV